MAEGENIKRFIPLSWFFIKTYYFNPVNNPVFVVLAVFIVVFLLDGSLDKYNMAFIIYLSIISHYFIGSMFKGSEESIEETSRIPIARYFHSLPLSGKQVYHSYLISSAIYVIFVYIIFTGMLIGLLEVPDYSEFNVYSGIQPLKGTELYKSVDSDDDTVTTMEGYVQVYPRRGPAKHISEVLKKSLIFDPFLKINKGHLWISLYFILTFLYISILHIFNRIFQKGKTFFGKIMHKIPLFIYLLIALLFLAEIMLTQSEISTYRNIVIRNLNLISLLFILTVAWTILSSIIMSRAIVKRMEGVS
ncbi:hypothetical protein JXI42_04325 [bacterium]|nr:hypothetical protein [bacterium]